MLKKLIGIFICTLMITTCILPVMGELITLKNEDKHSQKNVNDINQLTSGTTKLKFMIAGKAIRSLRSYWIHVPTSYNGSEAVPLVFVFHGTINYNSSDPFAIFHSSGIESYTEFSKEADEDGFIVVYPNALLEHYDPFITPVFNGAKNIYDFNFGWIPSLGWKFIDDIGFIHDLIHKMEQTYNINSSRIYVTGHSAGAFISYSIGSYLSDEVAAIGPVSGMIGGRANASKPFSYIPTPGNPVSVIAFHSTIDRNVPYYGSKYFVSVNTSISFWVKHDGCNPTPETNISASGKVIRQTYTNGTNGTEVVLYTFKYGGHIWPGNPINDPVNEISATELIWDFFATHPKK